VELFRAGGRYVVLGTQYLVLRAKYRLDADHLIPYAALACVLLTNATAFADEGGGTTAAAGRHDLPTMLFVFMLASFIGLGVITRVSRLLHTPLMSLTNAISAIAIVGAITVTGIAHGGHEAGSAAGGFSIINFLGAIALFASTVNIVSGFLITDRMLKMFKRA
jgi:NAD(P) transhydrogenase subunit alpha